MEFGLMLSGMKHDLQKTMALLAADFDSPAGPIPLERLLRKHHRLLADLRASGLTWEQISRLLAGAGVVHRNGRPFPPSHLRGVFGRQRKRLLTDSPKTTGASGSSSADGTRHRQGHYGSRREAVRPQRSDTTSKMIAASNHAGPNSAHPATSRTSADVSLDRSGDEQNGIASMDTSSINDRARVLALMRQSALARRVSE